MRIHSTIVAHDARPTLAPWILLSIALHGIVAAWLLSSDAVRFVSPVASEPPTKSVSIRLVRPPAPSVPVPPEPVVERPPVEPAIAAAPPRPIAETPPVRAPESIPAAAPPPVPRPALADAAPAEPQPAPTATPESTTRPPDVAAAPPAPASQPDARERWVQQVRSAILDHKRYPALARRRDIEGVVEAHVSIDARGRLAAVHIVDGAPRVLARATEQAIRKAAPFPAPPFGAALVQLPIDYDLVR